MTKLCVARFLRADLGQNLVEYALLLACVALSATVAMQAFGVMLGAKYGEASKVVTDAGTSARGGDNPGNPTPGAGTPGPGNPGSGNPGKGGGGGNPGNPTPGAGTPGQGNPGSGNPGKGTGGGKKP